MMLQINRMKSVSKCQLQMPTPIDKSRLLWALNKRCYLQHSLQHCFPTSKIIDQTLQNKKSSLGQQLKQIQFNGEEEIMEGYFKGGSDEIRELTEYYKYYTQTSILHISSFFNIMHQHREQQKAYHYNKFKALLELSNSTQNPSSEIEREEGPAPSFLILQQLTSTQANNEESLLIEKLKNKLQKDFGPNRYHTLQEIDKQYIFTKKIQIIPSPVKKTDKITQKYMKEATERTTSVKKRVQKKRNNTCDAELFNQFKSESQCKIKRKKNSSMASLASLGKSTPITRESSLKCTRALFNPIGNNQNQVKSKILGVKERIRQQKQQLLKKNEAKHKKQTLDRPGRKQRH